jgi:2-polyprenyl-6-methoxyphenol hydroxylase-like FAD-dependent oxidoreductase
LDQQTQAPKQLVTRCCIVGGGPAGMMLGYLLARAGIDISVLEKHADFLRDFRGDTVHPSTMDILHELGLLDEFLKRPHNEARQVAGRIGGTLVTVADFTHLPTHAKFVAFMPQWDFLNFLAEQGRRLPGFHVHMRTEAFDLIETNANIVGVWAHSPEGDVEVKADLVVGADGRHSIVRDKAALQVMELGAPMDVLWMRLSRHPGDPVQPLGNFDRGKIFVMLDRGDYWQCGYVIPKGGIDEIRARGLEALRQDISAAAPFADDRAREITDWDQVRLLTVAVDRLRQWYRPGLLCIGDSAHAMSPVGGVGINLAIQDAVAAANILTGPFRAGQLTVDHLKKVQKRRELPTRVIQGLQVLIQNRVIRRALASRAQAKLPWLLRLVNRWPLLRRIPARLIGIGFRPEHVSADLRASASA